ncbi:MAG TPA: porin [Burkholderiales bacterium]|nr:porin [Burkholderiales bacterium]
MKKTLMALAVGAAFVAPAALADVTISGAINMGIAYTDSDDGDASAGNSITGAVGTSSGGSNYQLSSNYSNITISSVDDLGGGLKLDFAAQMDWGGINTAGGGITNRNSHIGLVSESWGGVWYGTNENLYERYFYTVDPLDGAAGVGGNLVMLGTPGYGTVFDNGQAGCTAAAGCAGFYRRTDQTIWYDSPSFGGLTFGIYTTTTAFENFGPGGTNPIVMGGGAKWVGQGLPLQVWGAIEMHDDLFGLNAITGVGGATGSDDQAIQVGVGYTLGDIFIFANYEMLEYESDGLAVGQVNKYERDAASIGVKWNLASGYVGAQYIMAMEGDCELQGGGACNADDSDAQMIAAGYYHTMSKQTQAYVVGAWVDNGDLASYVATAGGISTNNNAPGADHLTISVGLKHSF